MTAKGTSKDCCCNGCERPPRVWANDGTDFEISQSWQRFCCSCIPHYACVTVYKTLGSNSASASQSASASESASLSASDAMPQVSSIYRLYCPPAPVGLEQPLYGPITAGSQIAIDGIVFDLFFHFIVFEGECRLCVRSAILGVDENTPGACVVINQESRNSPNFFCRRLSYTDAPIDGATDKDLGDAGVGVGTEFFVGDYTIVLSRANHIAITGRHACSDGAGGVVIDRHPIKNFCCNCTCVCKCMCITVTGIGISGSELACLYQTPSASVSSSGSVSASLSGSASLSASDSQSLNPSWTTASGITVSLGHPAAPANLLISCWKMDETSGSRFDSYGNNHTTSNNTVASTTGKIANAALFSGSNSLLVQNSPDIWLSNCNATIALWVKLFTKSTNQTLIEKLGAYKLHYVSGSDTFRFETKDQNGNVSAVESPQLSSMYGVNQWILLTASIDNDFQMISVQVDNDQPIVDVLYGSVPITSSNLYFGGQSDGQNYLDGAIDECIFYRKVFDNYQDAELNPLFNNGNGVTCGDQRCYLFLSSTGPIETTTYAPPVLINDVSNPCPRPEARWELQVPPASGNPGYTAWIEAKCSSCLEDCSVEAPECCTEERSTFPRVLNASIQTSCPDCPDISVPMVFNSSIYQWVGIGMMCGHSFEVRMGCPFNQIQFIGMPCIGFFDTDPSAACVPIYASFSGSTGGIGCCGGSSMINPTITITVYE